MKKWKPSSAHLVSLFERAMGGFKEAEKRKMFGYPCAFCNGNMFVGLHEDNLVLRLPAESRVAFLKIGGAKQFEPMPGRIMKEYVVVPKTILDDNKKLAKWIGLSLDYAKTLPVKKRSR